MQKLKTYFYLRFWPLLASCLLCHQVLCGFLWTFRQLQFVSGTNTVHLFLRIWWKRAVLYKWATSTIITLERLMSLSRGSGCSFSSNGAQETHWTSLQKQCLKDQSTWKSVIYTSLCCSKLQAWLTFYHRIQKGQYLKNILATNFYIKKVNVDWGWQASKTHINYVIYSFVCYSKPIWISLFFITQKGQYLKNILDTHFHIMKINGDWAWQASKPGFKRIIHTKKCVIYSPLCCSKSIWLSSLEHNKENYMRNMWPWTTKSILRSTSIFVAIANNTLYGSKLSIFRILRYY